MEEKRNPLAVLAEILGFLCVKKSVLTAKNTKKRREEGKAKTFIFSGKTLLLIHINSFERMLD
ncbi:MAG TPA: hypothetical protein VK892_10880 [Pyrinomonadaceae bacterium]|nr:hypothetical protein [Pyrinomonadaceae bacterium]